MVKVLFYDSSIDTTNSVLQTPQLLNDYFDIEVQKVLQYLHFAFKRNPQLSTLRTNKLPFTFSCDIRNPKLETIKPENVIDRPCVIFSCYKQKICGNSLKKTVVKTYTKDIGSNPIFRTSPTESCRSDGRHLLPGPDREFSINSTNKNRLAYIPSPVKSVSKQVPMCLNQNIGYTRYQLSRQST